MYILFNLLEQEWFTNLLTAVALAVGAGLSTLIGLFFNNLAKKFKNEKALKVISLVEDLIKDVVLTVQQTFVESLKAEGKFDEKAQKEALRKAFDLVLANLTKEAKEVLDEVYGDFEQWILIQIESAIQIFVKK